MHHKPATSSPQETSDNMTLLLQFLFQSLSSSPPPLYPFGFPVPNWIHGSPPANANTNASSSSFDISDSDLEAYDTVSEDGSEITTEETVANSNHPRSPSKRSRPPEDQKLQEKRRRIIHINQKVKELRQLIPNTSEMDKADLLEEAFEYLRDLQLHVGACAMMMGAEFNPFLPPGAVVQPYPYPYPYYPCVMNPQPPYAQLPSFVPPHGPFSFDFPNPSWESLGDGELSCSRTDVYSSGSNSFASETEEEEGGRTQAANVRGGQLS